jgi:DNA-binding beta-propeller fold protein YncE
MKTLTFLLSLILSLTVSAQRIRPVFFIADRTGTGSTHNAHITSDGKSYYTCIGGAYDKVSNGKINKYSLNGDFLRSYSFKNFDMRSIMYNRKDGKLYIATYDAKLYKIVDLENGTTQLVFEKKYKNPQSAIAMDPDGKRFYDMDDGTLTVHKLKDGSVIQTLSGLSFGADDKDDETSPKGRFGSTAVAVDNNYIYTWDAHASVKKIYAYDKKGKFIQAFSITSGNYGFSLSCANGYIFVAIDGSGGIGTWNGYKLWQTKGRK